MCCSGKVKGLLAYTQEPDSAPVENAHTIAVKAGRWICEAALWSQWIHVGTAVGQVQACCA
eukprot:6243499-Amphidinium_carterae.2